MKKRIAIFTYDLVPGRERLMPWRTVVETASKMRKAGHDARIISINGSEGPFYQNHELAEHVFRCRNIKNWREDSEGFSPDLVYWPVSWRGGLKSDSKWPLFGCPTVAYHSGSCYGVSHIWAALGNVPFSELAALTIETIIPKRLLIGKLKKKRVGGIVCMTEFTRQKYVQAGWPEDKCIAIPPGLGRISEKSDDNVTEKIIDRSILDKKYILFLGNPLPIRGSEILVAAAEKLVIKGKDIQIILLLRTDPGSEMSRAREQLLSRIKGLELDRRIICIIENLSPDQVNHFVKKAGVVALPFLYVPSEIPLAILEAMRAGTPVITTRAGGVSRYVGEAGWIIPPGDAASLAEAIAAAIEDNEDRKRKSAAAIKKMENHPDWDKVGEQWLDFGLSMIERPGR